MRKTLFLCALLLTSCTQKSPTPSSQEVRLTMVSEPVSLDPRLLSSIAHLSLARHLYEGLMRADCEGVPQPALAHHVECSEDKLTYTFYLREAYWTNGERITAHDFVRSWSQLVAPSFPSPCANMLYSLKNARAIHKGLLPIETLGVLALDDKTLVAHLAYPTPYFLELTSLPTLFPVHARQKSQVSIASGPFCLTKWALAEKLVLEKNPLYWDAEHVFLNKVEFSIMPDSNTESYLYQKGKLDWLGQPMSQNIATELIAKLKSAGDLHSYDIDGTLWLSLNVLTPPFEDPLIRHALALALNREQIITHILGGHQKAALSPLPPALSLQTSSHYKDSDVDQARKLFTTALQAQGWTLDTFPPLTLHYMQGERAAKIAQLIQQQWQEAFGFLIHLSSVELNSYRQQARLGKYQLSIGEWIADYHDPLSFLDIFVANTTTGWRDAIYTLLIEAATCEIDPEIRATLLRHAEQRLIEAMPVIPLYHFCFDYATRPHLENILLSPLGGMDLKSASYNHK